MLIVFCLTPSIFQSPTKQILSRFLGNPLKFAQPMACVGKIHFFYPKGFELVSLDKAACF
ncbi:hypothetical protein AB205_0087930 [Aquarana catesbeiana]|uniref:Uncharacterized protein n=1 Tax=Aquarana catesbeiana TaxID=8400 RepID=A0A2G9NC68_AQUCT|nr:hypothetical protein AB205_0087930 [Aquarana catesbeiana]